ncbi:MAG: SDR family NAD(P)-dependent oxidoreductase [Caulobacteraceae bacterium]|nr:SDR family NAD(P)-dependent oxidoreductase [Caulobacteraceae bacterium]
MATETVLVTGASGFIGGWCAARLLAAGYRVRATVRSEAKAQAVRRAVTAAGAQADALEFAVADLTADAGWDAAMAGCDRVLHVASPLSGAALSDLIGPARDGTLRVLAAARRAGAKRVVVTSSCAAVTPREVRGDTTSDETVWSDVTDPNLDDYRRSKTLAERAAWDWAAENGFTDRLTTVLPAAVFGPILSREAMSSVALIDGLLDGRPPRVPHIGFNVVDVRDVADLHLKAMTAPEAAGQRFIAAGERMWMGDVAAVLKAGLGRDGARVPTKRMSDPVVRLLAVFIPRMRNLVPMLGRRHSFSADKARRVLGFAPRPTRETLLDCARSLIGDGAA